jgi:hypothetical protein
VALVDSVLAWAEDKWINLGALNVIESG